MIIDVHAHWGPWFFTMDVAGVNHATMDRYGIGHAIVSATEAVIYDPATGNRALAEWLAGTDRHFGYVTINPRRLAQAERDLQEYLPTGLFKGVKIHTDYTRSPADSPQTREALALVAAHGVPALVHTWGATVLDLARTCLDIPGLRVIAGHMGADGHRFAIEAANSCDRLYLEPCWSHAPARRIAEVAAAVNPDRLLFGTDSTLIDPSSAFGAVAAAQLAPDVAEKLAWRNAAALFNLPV
ncbi:amidohydrolase family protein [Nonomuraea typhae]|uniref:amidohydrolase family protein n=1 Tax=Nonomuraea typhae TaxID=2603600 RepID=UPI0012FC95F5|nr:amidohydrolase family protein [Nonomuraea typhae]